MSQADIIINSDDRLVGSTAAAAPRSPQSLLSPGTLTQLGRLWRRRPDDEMAGAEQEWQPRTEAEWSRPVVAERSRQRVEPLLTPADYAGLDTPDAAQFDPPPFDAAPRQEPVPVADIAPQANAPSRQRRPRRSAPPAIDPVADPVQSALPRAAGWRARLRAHIRRNLPRLGFTPLQRLAAGGIGVLTATVTLAVIWHSGIIQRTVQAGVDAVFAATGRAGFRVADITVAGRARTSMDQVAGALGAGIGTPILAIDLEEVKDRLEALASVRQAAVERVLPGTLHIALAERQPIAVWQNNGEHVLVDDEGKVIPGTIAGFETLPLVVGDGAGPRADEILAMLSSEPSLAPRVKAAIRVGNRRWNLMLDDPSEGLEIRLPEDEAEAAWHRLAELERQQGLSARHVRMVDLRQPDRLILKTERPATAPETVRRKDNGAG